jgi:dipeptidyl aminopeptidase/acylaminoacyl peptidase
MQPQRIYGNRLRLILIVLFIAAAIAVDHLANRHPSGSAIITEGIPPVPAALKHRMECYQNRQFIRAVDWAPDGKGIVVIGRINETSQVYTVAGPARPLQQKSVLGESIIDAAVCPDAERDMLLFTHDSGGDENFRICALRFDRRDTVRLTGGTAQNDGIAWSNRGNRFACSSNRRNGRDVDIWITHVDTPASPHCLIKNGGTWQAFEWSPDDRKLLVGTYVSRTSSRLFICDIDNGSITPLTDTTAIVSEETGVWGPNEGIFYTSDRSTDFRCLHHIDIATRHDTILTSAIPWDVREVAISRDRKKLAFTTNEHGFSRLYIMNTVTFDFRCIHSLPRGITGSMHFDTEGKRLLMDITTAQHPADAYILDINDTVLTRWTVSVPAGKRPAHQPADPEIIEYPTFDSVNGLPRRIPTLVYRPSERKRPTPVLIMVHGGPETQFWPSFRPEVNFYLGELGIAVVAPNVRGSGGYGKRYLELDNGILRNGAVRDIGALIDWIGSQSGFDTSRIAITGGSYGGYMALAAMVQYGPRLRAGIDCYGIGNFVTFLENTAGYRRDLRRAEYGDERDSAMRRFLIEVSPLTGADRINKPLLIIQGANDPRVPLTESRQIADAVRKNSSPVWFLIANDEGHGFRKRSNLDYQDWVTAMFLKKYLSQ